MKTKKPYFVSFHSLKGGIGRTTNVSHVAKKLSEMGFNVLAFDLDLSSPDLKDMDVFKELHRESYGFIHFLNNSKQSLDAGKNPKKIAEQIEKIIVHGKTDPENYPVDKDPDKQFSIIPAYGRERSDNMLISGVDWIDLYRHKDKRGFRFWASIKATISKMEFDYVLMDVDRGIDTWGRIANVQFADLFVTFLQDDDRSIQKTKKIVEFFKEKQKPIYRSLEFACVSIKSNDRQSVKDNFINQFGQSEFIGFHDDPDLIELLSNYIIQRNKNETSEDRRRAYVVYSLLKSSNFKEIIQSILLYEYRHFKAENPSKEIKENIQKLINYLKSSKKISEASFCESIIAIQNKDILIETLKQISELPTHSTGKNIIEILIDSLRKDKNLNELQFFMKKIQPLFIKNGWFWAAFFAVMVACDQENEGNENKHSCEYVQNYLSKTITNIMPDTPNPYRPGMAIDLRDHKKFWGNTSNIEKILGEKGLQLLIGQSGWGRTWLIQKMESFCKGDKDSKNHAKEYLGDFGFTLPESSFLISGKTISEQMKKNKSIDSLITEIKNAIDHLRRDGRPEIPDKISNFYDLEQYTDQYKNKLKNSALFFDDIDITFQSMEKIFGIKKYSKIYSEFRSFLEKGSIGLICFSVTNAFVSKETELEASMFINIFSHNNIKEVTNKDISNIQVREMIESIKKRFPFFTQFDAPQTYFEYQALFWGYSEWQKKGGDE